MKLKFQREFNKVGKQEERDRNRSLKKLTTKLRWQQPTEEEVYLIHKEIIKLYPAITR